MPALTPRTRLIFQNLNLFAGPAAQSGSTATGSLYSLGNSGNNLILQLAHVQSATLSASINRQDVNIFGILNRIDQVIISPATFTLDFVYYPNDGYNEYVLGLDTQGNSFISGILTKASDSKNYFISISEQGIDDDTVINPTARDVLALGNGFISNYTFNAAVGQIPTSNVTIDAQNIVAYTGASGLQTPAIDPSSSVRLTGAQFNLPYGTPITGVNIINALRPGDISLSFPAGAGFLTPLSGQYSVNVQSVSMSIPIGREVLNRLGSPFGFSREIKFPVNTTMQIRALQTDVQLGSFDQLYCNDQFYNMSMLMRAPSCQGTGAQAIILGFNQAKVTNQSFGFTINGDATVDLSLTCQLAGATSTNGITFSGAYLFGNT